LPLNERKATPEYRDMLFEDIIVGEGTIRREKEKARRLRQTAWWMRKIQKGVCHYCQSQVGREHLTMDHVVPLSRGGKSSKGNIVPACKTCNNKKKYLLPIEWDEYLQSLRGS
jgi:5-methylcytosine-specific restriction protein A